MATQLTVGPTLNVLYEDEFWVIRNCGPRMWSAHRKSDGEHRLYWSFESLERDFGRIKPSTARLTAGGQLTADTPQPDATQADAESSESGQ